MNKTFPELIQQLHKHNEFDLNKFLHCGIPFLRLDLDVPNISVDEFEHIVSQCNSWRSQWKMVEENYQVKEWNGHILFGPQDWELWLETIGKDSKTLDLDEDGMCAKYRSTQTFDWNIDCTSEIRKWVSSIFPTDDCINLVNVYNIPPGGYLFPHIDNNPTPHLNKIYVALNWPSGNYFGFNGFGNMPVEPQSAWLINNYRYSHWVYNDSNENRLVMAIAGDLHSIKDLIYQSWIKMLTRK